MTGSIEVKEIHDFLARCMPFDQLPRELLSMAARTVCVRYFRKGSCEDVLDHEKLKLYVVRSGAFEIRNAQGELVDRVDEGGCFGYPSLLTGHSISNRAVILEDGLIYQLEEEVFQQLRAHSRDFDRFFAQAHAKRLHQPTHLRDKNHQMVKKVNQLIRKAPVAMASTTCAREAAQVMTRERISSMLICDEGHLVGILTDRDLRARVLAHGLGGDTLLADIMTPDPASIGPDAYVFEAIVQMSERNIHHLPVVEGGVPVGVLSATDIVKAQKSDPIYLIGEISRQNTVEGLVRVSQDIPELLRNLIELDARADEIGRIVTTVADSLTRQLIRQARHRFGEPPVPFAWLAFGSQGRQDQAGAADQDNALLLADAMRPEDDSYFGALAKYVCDGLDACGYAYCNGEIMAMNPRWRQPLQMWRQYFLGWINEPEPKALMHSSIFFDMRRIYGDPALVDALRGTILAASQGNGIFLACLTQNALQSTPPLGFFKKLVLERDGEHAETLDMKHRGVVPVTDIARVYALAAGVPEVNTMERLAAVAGSEWLTSEDANDLMDALEFIAHLRLLSQGEQLKRGESPNNYLSPDSISDLLRIQLRDSFGLVNSAQSALKLKFTGGYL